MKTIEIIGLVFGSGVLVAIINQIGNYIFDRRKRKDAVQDKSDDMQIKIDSLSNDSTEQFALVNKRIDSLETKVDSISATTDALCGDSIARSYIEIRRRALACIKSGEVDGEEQRDIEDLYRAYANLPSANGYLKPIMEEFRKLKIK